ncbi:MAG: recombinase RecA [Planctomycetales bacterium]|nr:recombinase RecA [Planctomycetales bacterium]
MERQSTGIPALDEHLGGGLLPGTLTVVVGATGIGKSQLGVQFAEAGRGQESRGGVFLDLSARGDSQNHIDYAQRICGWEIEDAREQRPPWEEFFAPDREFGDCLAIFGYRGRRVTRQDLDFDQWRNWQAELNAKLQSTIGFLYGNFVQGVRRLVVDGVEPTDRPSDSIQFNLFEYIYHQVVRKEAEWVARDLFRESYRSHAAAAAANVYDSKQIGCLLLYTSRETMLDDLIERPLDEGDVLSNANTLILMGKVKDGLKVRRGLFVAKHRGSACSDEILPYRIDSDGLHLEDA